MDSCLILSMLDTLSNYKRNKSDLLQMYINDRLSSSLENYYIELSNNYDYLINRESNRVLKNM